MHSEFATTSKENSPLPARRILVMRYRFIGDTILTVPFLRNLRAAYPDAVIDVLVGPQSGEVLNNCPYVNELITFDTTDFHKYDRGTGKKRNFLGWAWELRSRKYDLIFLLKRSMSSAVLAALAGARYRVGYDTEGRRLLLTHPVKWDSSIHEVESTLDVLKAAGVGIIDKHLECWISAEEEKQILSRVPELSSPLLKVLFHPAAAHPDKMYPLEHWAEAMKQLSDKHQLLPFFVGAVQDRQIYERLEALSGIKGINLAGQLSIRESLALMTKLDMAICVDSGPAHLAAAAGLPVVTLFGPTDPERWRPWGDKNVVIADFNLECRPCNYKKVCDDERPCLTALSPQLIVESADRIIARDLSHSRA
jgi:heptosyltransferase-2